MFWTSLFMGVIVASAPPTATPVSWTEAAILGSGGLAGADGQLVIPADLEGMTGSKLGAAIASGELWTGWPHTASWRGLDLRWLGTGDTGPFMGPMIKASIGE